jgi:hypothetical protein
MTEAEWLTTMNPERMHDFVLPRDYENRKYRLFAVACCRFFQAQIHDRRCQKGIEVAEMFADKQVKLADLRAMMEFVRDGLYLAGINAVAAELVRPEPCYLVASATLKAAMAVRGKKGGIRRACAAAMRDIFGNPFRPATLDPSWLTSTVVALARGIYEERAFDRMPILADALQDAGCDNEDVLNHCRGPGPHVRGCWVVDLVLGKE